MYYSTAKEMEKLDILAVKHGLEIRQMMELAGWQMINVFNQLKINKNKKIVIIVGKGNKGGDGLSATRHLINHGWNNIFVILVSRDITKDSEHHLNLLKIMKVKINLYSKSNKVVINDIATADYIIDSLIGYHLQGSPRGDFEILIELMNAVLGKIIAYDLPSGLDATTGEILEPCIRADSTLTLALLKKTFQTKSGKSVSGQIFLGDIGIPDFLYNKIKKNSRPDFMNKGIIKI